MNLTTQLKTYIKIKNISIPYVIVIIGLVVAPTISYSWIISMIACLFLKEDEID